MENLLKYIKSTFNYRIDIDAVEYSKNGRLKLYNRPICNVYVTPLLFPELKKLEDEYLALVEKAIEIINQTTKGKVTFRLTDTMYGANVKLYWAKTTRTSSGLQFFEKIHTKIKSPSVSIGVMDMCGEKYTYPEILAIILHEFGHVLGLGHSFDKNDLMYSEWNPEVQDFSKNDKFVLDLIYSIGNRQPYSIYEDFIYKKAKTFKDKFNTPNDTKKLFCDLDYIANTNKINLVYQNIKINCTSNYVLSLG